MPLIFLFIDIKKQRVSDSKSELSLVLPHNPASTGERKQMRLPTTYEYRLEYGLLPELPHGQSHFIQGEDGGETLTATLRSWICDMADK